ncbi:hypothetical protein [Pigmentiphaga sp.]|uniref:hypothetical protein n=1 Tax=Pigmentiphaga sp. TaxID=1977564 RepID=UPI00128DD354|nr:hypothetical protein [Pigmentiphaga sp.]MPS30610.1 hypothetical protein [Alcaligenaceae bacterium SAGV5]MPS53119.1 hypothetical protein [Alcaligenaceae bacterium SAGV3]MPT57698.1 hypothetical protein [Alcaligenaceae bacterium]
MQHHDLAHWPLVVSVSTGAPTLADTQAFSQAWDEWLAREQPFASLRVFADAASLTHPPGAAQHVKQWFGRQAPAIRDQVMGMANVVPPEEFERVSRMNIEKLFGVPAATFADLPSALAWLRDRVFAPRGLPFDEAVATAAVQGKTNAR